MDPKSTHVPVRNAGFETRGDILCFVDSGAHSGVDSTGTPAPTPA